MTSYSGIIQRENYISLLLLEQCHQSMREREREREGGGGV